MKSLDRSTYFFHDFAHSRQHDDALSATVLGGIDDRLLEALSFFLYFKPVAETIG